MKYLADSQPTEPSVTQEFRVTGDRLLFDPLGKGLTRQLPFFILKTSFPIDYCHPLHALIGYSNWSHLKALP